MARTFRRKRTAHPIADLNITNMVDLAFVLLIVFMIAAPLIQEQSIPVNLPTVAKAPPSKASLDDRFVPVGVDAEGRFFIENNTTPVSLSELQARLRAYAAEEKPPVIQIRGDYRAYYQKIAELMIEVQRSGLTRVTFDSQAKE